MRGYKIKIYPTEDQKEKIDKMISLYRFSYNWAISEIESYYREFKKFINLIDLLKLFSSFRNSNDWLNDIPYSSCKIAIRIAYRAFLNFLSNQSRYPKFKTKKRSIQSLGIRNERNAFYFKESKVRISGLNPGDLIECKSHDIPRGPNIQYYGCTIVKDGYEYWLSVNIEQTIPIKPIPSDSENVLGIDVGVRTFATLSNGITYNAPNNSKLIKRARRHQSKLSKLRNARVTESIRTKTKFEDVPISKNEIKLQKLYRKTKSRIKNRNIAFLHNTTSSICNMGYGKIVMEDFSVRSMQKHRHVSKLIAMIPSLYSFKFQMKYKCRDNGIDLEFADKYFPSTQICSNCGSRHKVGTSKVYVCPNCGFTIDRDLNAAINLSRY